MRDWDAEYEALDPKHVAKNLLKAARKVLDGRPRWRETFRGLGIAAALEGRDLPSDVYDLAAEGFLDESDIETIRQAVEKAEALG